MPRGIINFVLAVVVAWIVGMVLRMTFSHGVFLLVLLGVPLGFVAWMFLARQHWWVIVPIAFAFGGKVYAGVRLFSYELAMLLAASALIPLYLIQALRTMPRPRVPLMVWLLLGYLFVHCTYSVAMEHAGSSGGEGNILRVYFRGIWPLLFAIAFTLYGSTQALRTCLAGMFAFTFVRAALVVLGYYYPY
ncbi:MAG: hypothetical protein O3A51_00955, partial [Verrucomicrobia bacterium]|nr:hypothetical protein [Verrucomicrobiota bacterium]